LLFSRSLSKDFNVGAKLKTIQKILLFIFAKVGLHNISKVPLLEKLFQISYFQYKKHIEDPYYNFLRQYSKKIPPGNFLDIGANIGYTTWVFSQFLAPGKKIFSFEPEQKNFEILSKFVAAKKLGHLVSITQAACGESNGTIKLLKNEKHHADHRVLTTELEKIKSTIGPEFEVPIYSMDSFAEQHKIIHDISFVKIDVQGYENPVIKGMSKIILNNPKIIIAFELSPEQISELGFKPQDLIDQFAHMNLYQINKNGSLQKVLSRNDLSKNIGDKYRDLVATTLELSNE
jgi:FkbM family methyltransferase